MRIFLQVLKISNGMRLVFFPFEVELENWTYSSYDLLEPFIHILLLVILILERHLEYHFFTSGQ